MSDHADEPTDEESSEQSAATEETTMTDTDETEPSETPPRAASATETAAERPTQDPPATAESTAEDVEAATPTERPPSETEGEDAYGATTWHNGKKITALWSIDQNRNAWIYVAGLGWKKLADNSDSAVVALTALATHAKRTGATANLREDGGKITQIYVW